MVAGAARRKPRPRSEWNSNLTDDDKYKLPQEEALRRKQLFISKHNILTSSPHKLPSPLKMTAGKRGGKPAKRRLVRTRKDLSSLLEEEEEEDILSTNLDEVTSLDLLTAEGVSTEETPRELTPTTHKAASTRLRSTKPRQKPIKITQTRPTAPIKSPETLRSPVVRHTPTHNEPSVHMTPPTVSPRNKKGKPELNLSQREMTEIGSMIEMLHSEVNHYEQITGKKSAIDIEEMKMVTGIDALAEDGSDKEWAQKSPITVMRYLVHLVCQSMSYMLQSEVEKVSQKKQFDELNGKVAYLMALNSYEKSSAELSSTQYSKTDFAKKEKQSYQSTPSNSGLTKSTPQTDKTIDLYAETSDHLTDPMYRTSFDPSSSLYDTPTTAAASSLSTREISATPSSGSQHKVRFRLDDEDNDHKEQIDSLQLGSGTATSDWLFTSAASLTTVDDFNNTPSKMPSSSSSSPSTDEMVLNMTPPKPPSVTPPASARVQELQRQLALIRQQPNRSEVLSYTSDNFKMESDAGHYTLHNAAFSEGNVVKIPRLPIPKDGIVDDFSAHITPRSDSHIHHNDHKEDDEHEIDFATTSANHMSLSSIPSQLLPPTPERQPTHPFQTNHKNSVLMSESTKYEANLSYTTTSSGDIPNDFDKAAFMHSFQQNSKPIYDARRGAFSAH